MKTLLLTQKDIASVLTPALANNTVEKAFRAHGLGLVDMPAKSYLFFPEGDLRSMPAYISGEGFDIAGVKSVNVHPQNPALKLPSVMAVIILVEAAVFPHIDEVTLDSDIVVTTTPSRSPLVKHVSPGTHINAIGADAPGKQEIHPDIIKKAKVIIDDWAQAAHSGEINVPLLRKQISKRNVYSQLGAIVTGEKKGRTSAAETTLFDSTGLAVQDITCAFVAYQILKKKRGIQSIKLF